MGRWWTEEEQQYLAAWWGVHSVPCIARHLGRTTAAVKYYASSHGYGPQRLAGSFVSTSYAHRAIRGTSHMCGERRSAEFFERHGLRVHTGILFTARRWSVDVNEFWRWAGTPEGDAVIIWDRFEPLSMGPEPRWVEARRKECAGRPHRTYRGWTNEEDKLLMAENAKGLPVEEIARHLDRTARSVRGRIWTLCLYRPATVNIGRE